MLHSVCGPLAPHTVLVSQLTKAALKIAYGELFSLEVNVAASLREGVMRRSSDNCLFVFDSPDRAIADSIQKNGIPTVFVAESFIDSCCYAMHVHGSDLTSCIRAVTKSFASLHPIATLPNAIPIPVSDDMELSHLITRISMSLGLELDLSDIEKVISPFLNDHAWLDVGNAAILSSPRTALARQSKSILQPSERELLIRLSEAYDPLLAPASPQHVSWPIETMMHADTHHQPVSGSFDLTGPGRILTFGPYFHLPVGNWSAELCFAVTENYSGNVFMVDVLTNGENLLAAAKGDLPAGGTFVTRLNFQVFSPHDAIEFRTFLLTGAIEGNLELLNLTMHRL